MRELMRNNIPYDAVQKLFAALSLEGEARLVGGCVREMLVGNAPKDIDVASQVKPERAMVLLERDGFKCIPTGIKHGTITAIYDDVHIEVTTLRSDIATNGRHAEVRFTDDWAEDAKRRDFTINAMYMDLDGNIYDYFNGQEDLNAKLVRFVGEPNQRIEEDYLRIMRYFRFSGYLDAVNIDQASFDACAKYREKINMLSGERIREELFKILSLKHVHHSLQMMYDASVLDVILNDKIAADILSLQFAADALANFIAILIHSKYEVKLLPALLEKLKLSNIQKRYVSNIFENINLYNLELLHDHKKMLYLDGVDLYKIHLEVARILGSSVSYVLDESVIPVFPVKGLDLQKMYFEGKQIGDKISHLERIWIESDFSLNKEELLKFL